MRYIAFSLLVTLSISVNAAEIILAGFGDGYCDNIESQFCISLLVEGEIIPGDSKKLEDKMSAATKVFLDKGMKARVGVVYFNSDGGDLIEGLKLGRVIRAALAKTMVDKASHCYSSCVFAFAGGVWRLPVGEVGIHSFYAKEAYNAADFKNTSERYNRISKVVNEFLLEMRINRSLLDTMIQIPSKSMKVLSYEELQIFGLFGGDPVYSTLLK